MKIRMIALDVDGTLINDDFAIMPKTKEILQQAYQEGIILTLCTGRNPASTTPLMEELGVEGPVVVHNGAVCFHSGSGKIYGEVGFPIDELAGIIRYCREHKLHFDVNTAFEIYVENMNSELEKLYQAYYAKPKLISDALQIRDQVVKFSILGEEEALDRAIAELRESYPYFRIIRSGETYIDIIHPLVSKGYGLKIVCEQIGIPLEQVMAFGNYYNDIEMLKEVGFGIAMENSPDEVKEAAKAVTRSNNEEGIYFALKKHLYLDRIRKT